MTKLFSPSRLDLNAIKDCDKASKFQNLFWKLFNPFKLAGPSPVPIHHSLCYYYTPTTEMHNKLQFASLFVIYDETVELYF